MWFEDAWDWIKTAPLPVVLVFSLAAAAGAIGYARTVRAETRADVAEAQARVDDAHEHASRAQVRTQEAELVLKRMEDKMDKLIDAVAQLRAEVRTETRRRTR